MYIIYKIVALFSFIIRQFLIPNPFESLRGKILINFGTLTVPIPPELINLMIEPILFFITYTVVGIYYNKEYDEPILGSILYLFFYAIHVGLICFASYFGFSWIAIAVTLAIYIAIHIVINKIRNSLCF